MIPSTCPKCNANAKFNAISSHTSNYKPPNLLNKHNTTPPYIYKSYANTPQSSQLPDYTSGTSSSPSSLPMLAPLCLLYLLCKPPCALSYRMRCMFYFCRKDMLIWGRGYVGVE